MDKGEIIMKIVFSDDFQDVNAFTTGIQYFSGDITLSQGKHIVNARSFLGICSLNINEPMDVKIETYDEGIKEDFYNYVRKWEVNE